MLDDYEGLNVLNGHRVTYLHVIKLQLRDKKITPSRLPILSLMKCRSMKN